MTGEAISSECNQGNETVTGEYWSYAEPTFYSLKYFKYTPATGGFGNLPVEIEAVFTVTNPEILLGDMLKLHEKYPYVVFTFKESEAGDVRISTGGYMVFDYHMAFVSEMESILADLEDKGELRGYKGGAKWKPKKIIRGKKKSQLVVFPEKGISWVHTSPNEETGLESQRLRIDFHHSGRPKVKAFFKELDLLLEEHQIEYLDYREYRKNFMVFIGNGRQGVNGSPVTCSNFEGFKPKVIDLLAQFGFKLEHDKAFVSYEVGLDDYSKLTKSKPIVVRDKRRFVEE